MRPFLLPFFPLSLHELIFLPRRGSPCGSPRWALGSVFGFQHVNVLLVVPGRFELPTSTLSV